MTNGEKIQQMIPSVDVIEITDKLVRYVRVEQRDEHNRKSSTWIADVNIDWWNAEYKEPTTKNDLGVNCIDRAELLKAMNTWPKFGNDPNIGLVSLITPALQDRYVPYVKYDDMVNCVKGMFSVTLIRPKGHWILRNSFLVPYKCSECNYESERYDNFCPNCGADMRVVEE